MRPNLRHVTKQEDGDAAVIFRIAQGELRALGEIYDRHHVNVRRALARITPDTGDIDDIVQLTFLELLRIAGSFDGRDSARAWLMGIAVRLAWRRRRSFARRNSAHAAFAHAARGDESGDPEAETGAREELRLFERALARLSVEKRSVFVLVELEGMSAADVAISLEIPASTARTRLFHARAELRAALEVARACESAQASNGQD